MMTKEWEAKDDWGKTHTIVVHMREPGDEWPEDLPNYDPAKPLYGHTKELGCRLCEDDQ